MSKQEGKTYFGYERKKEVIALYLCELAPGESGSVLHVEGAGRIGERLRNIGLCEDTKIIALQKSPLGDPTAYLVRGSVFAIRRADTRKIQIKRV